jgi:hypothetical protein
MEAFAERPGASCRDGEKVRKRTVEAHVTS